MTDLHYPDGVLLHGDCRVRLAELDAESIQTCICSPPYYGLRSYQGLPPSTWPDGWVGCLGNEPNLDLFLVHLIDVFRAVRRVLRRDGVIFCNLGDSYSSGTTATRVPSKNVDVGYWQNGGSMLDARCNDPSIPAKNLLLVPERFAIAAQADGWYVRSRIVWAKKSSMPESVTDRPTSAHETVWMLTRESRYFYDAEAVKLPVAESMENRVHLGERPQSDRQTHLAELGFHGESHRLRVYDRQGANLRNTWLDVDEGAPLSDLWELGPEPNGSTYCGGCDTLFDGAGLRRIKTFKDPKTGETVRICPVCGATDRWVAHFAAYPSALVKRCILAATPEHGCCAECGAPWKQVMEQPKPPVSVYTNRNAPTDELVFSGQRVNGDMKGSGAKYQKWRDEHPAKNIGFAPTCAHNAARVPSTVLDPFMGSGTTAIVARSLGRRFVGVEGSSDYVEMAAKRIEQTTLALAETATRQLALEGA